MIFPYMLWDRYVGLLVTICVPSWYVLPAVTCCLHGCCYICDSKGCYWGVWRCVRHLNANNYTKCWKLRLLWPVVPCATGWAELSGSPLHQLNAGLSPTCSSDRGKVCCRVFWALRKPMINMTGQHLLEHAHKKWRHYICKYLHSFTCHTYGFPSSPADFTAHNLLSLRLPKCTTLTVGSVTHPLSSAIQLPVALTAYQIQYTWGLNQNSSVLAEKL